MSQRGGVWLGVITCARPRCRYEFTWELESPEPAYSPTYYRLTDSQRAEIKAAQTVRWQEVLGKPLPAEWVKLRYMLYREDLKSNPDWLEFHSPHCAALYLDSLPGAKGDQDPRRMRS